MTIQTSEIPSPSDRTLVEKIRATILAKPGTYFAPSEIAQEHQIDLEQAEKWLEWLGDLKREYEEKPDFRGIARVFVENKTYFEALSDNPDVRRDYDYRATNDGGRDFCPKNMFYYMWAWTKMVERNCQDKNVTNNRVALITRDCRYYPPEIIEAAKESAMLLGYKVVFAFAGEGAPSCVSSYSHAVRMVNPTLAVFITASHVSRPIENTVVGAKVSFLGPGGELESLSTKDIKVVTAQLIHEAKESCTLSADIHPSDAYEEMSAGRSHTRMASAAVLSSLGLMPGLTLYGLSQRLKEEVSDIDGLLKEHLPAEIPKPLEGLTVVVEGAHTSSGMLAERAFSALGARTHLLRGDIKDICGPHDADPSVAENLDSLLAAMKTKGANMGIAFDLDGDRGAIVLPSEAGDVTVLAPDKLGQVLIPFLMDDGGYSEHEKPLFVRDCLSTDALIDQGKLSGVTVETTDAGYVFLKKHQAERAENGYLAISMSEASGHAWLDFTGPFENPIVLSLLFAAMCMRHAKAKGMWAGNSIAPLALEQIFNELAIPYRKSVRFQPLFARALVEEVEKSPSNDTGWSAESGRPIPQKLINLCRSASIDKLKQFFTVGRTFTTPIGDLSVTDFEFQWDEAERIYRYGKIYFALDSVPIGSFVSRGSSNDPTAVQVWEVKEFAGDSWTGTRLSEEEINNRFDLVGGLVLHTCAEQGILDLGDRRPAVNIANILPSLERYLAMIEAP